MSDNKYPFKDGDYLWGIFAHATKNDQGQDIATIYVHSHLRYDENGSVSERVTHTAPQRYDFVLSDKHLDKNKTFRGTFSEYFLDKAHKGYIVGAFIKDVPISDEENKTPKIVWSEIIKRPRFGQYAYNYAAITLGNVQCKLGLK